MSISKGRTILLVEDEFLIAMAEKKQLERYGYAIKTVNSGEAAIEAVETSSGIDLILMDINLGAGIDGTEAAAVILKKHDIPIVFVSSHTEPEIVEKTERITSYGYVVKNSSVTVLDASIKMAFKLFDANQSIKNSEAKQKAMISNISDVIGIIGADGILKYKSSNIEKWFGWKPEDLIGTDGWLTVHPSDLVRIQKEFNNLLAKESATKTVEYQYKCKDGSYKLIELTATNLLNDPNINGILMNYHDISERSAVEDLILTSEKRYRGLLENLDIGIVVHAPDTSILMNNPRASELLGLSDSQLRGKVAVDPAWRFVSEDRNPLPISEYPVNRIVVGKKPIFPQILGVHQPDTEQLVWLTVNGYPMLDGKGEISEIIISFADITGRRNNEQALQVKNEEYEAINEELRSTTEEIQLQNQKLMQSQKSLIESEKRLQQAEKVAKIGNWTLDMSTRTMIASSGADDIYGVDFKKVPLVEVQRIPLAEYRPALDTALSGLVRQNIPYDLEFKIRRPSDGKIRDIHSVAAFDKKTNTVFGVIQDITEQKTAKMAMKESEVKYSTYIENAPDGVFVADARGRYVEVNKAACLMTGYSKQELLRMSIPDLLFKESLQEGLDSFKEVSETGSTNVEIPFRHKDGSKKWWSVNAVKINETQAIAFTKDITERKNQVAILNDLIGMNSKMLLSKIDLDFNDMVLETITKVTGAKYSAFNVFDEDGLSFTTTALHGIGEDLLKISKILGFNPLNKKWDHDPVRASKIHKNTVTYFSSLSDLTGYILPAGIVEIIESILDIRKAVIIKVSVNNIAVGDFTLFFSKASTIKNIELAEIFANQVGMSIVRMRNEAKIKSLLEEKELILKEVHHRMKNNMNTLSSLLSLQADKISEPTTLMILKETGSRIQSMSLLYDKLYRSQDYSELSSMNYLAPLVDEVIVNFPNSRMVKVEKNIQDFNLDVKRLQSLGILINELISNTMKYAFVGKDRGHIEVAAVMKDGRVIVSVQDDGIGIPEAVTFENTTGFGLQLVYALSQQLEGKIRIERGNGTKVVLDFDA